MHRRWTSMLVVAAFLVAPWAEVAGRPRDSSDVTPASAAAAEKGLDYLARTQNANGSWTCRVGYKLNETYQGREYDHVGVTAIAGMAFLAHGDTPHRGKYAFALRKAADYVLQCVREEDGYISANGTRMYSHAFATLFLAELYGNSSSDDVGDALRHASRLIIGSQNHKGGWRYQPTPVDADISVTVSTLQALRAARNAGVAVPKETIDAAMEYVHRCARAGDGSFSYQDMTHMLTRSSFALTGAGVTSLYSAGEYDSPEVARGIQYLARNMPPGFQSRQYHYFYGHYYAAQAFYQRGGQAWEEYYPRVREEILRGQQPDGSWSDDVGRPYATAMACIILQIPAEYLPIFQR